MGNAVALSVTFERDDGLDVRRAGYPLRGRVTAVVKKRVAGAPIVVVLHGKEKSFVKRGKDGFWGSRQFFQTQLVLQDLSNQYIDPGTHYFPFSVNLPDSLPASSYVEIGGSHCTVRYKAQASIGSVHGPRTAVKIKSAPLPNVQVPCFLEPRTTEIKTFGKGEGAVTFAAGVTDTHVGKGSWIEVSLACLNNASVDIQNVDIKLVELCEWTARGRGASNKRELFQQQNVNLPGLLTDGMPRSSIPRSQESIAEVHNANYLPIYNALRSPNNRIRFRIPEGARDTYVGTVLSITHYLKIYLNTKKMTDNLSTKIPLRIGTPPVLLSQTATPFPPRLPSTGASAPALRISRDVPMIAAVPAPDDTEGIDLSGVSVLLPLSEATVIGGREMDDSAAPQPSAQLVNIVPVPPPTIPSFASLLEEMVASINDCEIIASKMQHPAWRLVFESLTPQQFGSVIGHVNMDHDQPRVAVLLAPLLNGRDNFTCHFCVAALKNTADWNRSAMVERLLPFCRDLSVSYGLIHAELSEWERTVTDRFFAEALAS